MMDVRLALVLFTALLVACGGRAAALPAADLPAPRVIDSAAVAADVSANEDEVSMEIIELMCNPCAAQIVGKSRLVPGVTHVSMVLATKTLTVRYDRDLVARDQVIASVEQIVAGIQ
jgi:copper chaperone CopZ